MRRRLRSWIAAGTMAVFAGAAALGGASAASAATTPSWGSFALTSTTARAYTGTMELDGFPRTTFTSTARQATVVSGASTWQGPSTPPGQLYGSSRGESYLNLRPGRDQPNAADASVTTYTFDGSTTPMPVGAWSFVLGDIDADQATITATDTTGAAVPASALGYRSSYNSCSSVSPGGQSCARTVDDPTPGSDTPTWVPATATLTGNATASDTSGATAWFTPTVALGTLTITYQQRSGFPVYQTWFAVAASISGTATLDGQAYRGATVEVRLDGVLVATATTDADGAYTIPGLSRSDGYVVSVAPPTGAIGGDPRAESLSAGSATDVDFAFTSPPGTTSVTGTVVSSTTPGTPAAGVPVTITDPEDPANPVTVVSNDGGGYAVAGLDPETVYDVTAPGATPTTVTTGAAGAPGATVPPVAVPDVTVPTVAVSGAAYLDDAPYPDAEVTISTADGTVVGTTTTGADGGYSFPALAEDATYTVRITPPGGADGTATQTAVVATSDVVVTDFRFTTPAPATVGGAGGVATSDGAPVVGTTVTLTPAGGGTPITAETLADGTYTVAGLVPGTTYTATAPGAAPVTFTVADEDVDIATLVVPSAVRATGTVTDSSGVPAAGVSVVVVAVGGTPVTTTTAADGTYSVDGLTPSTGYTATAAGADPVSFTTTASGTTTIPAITLRAVVTPPTGGIVGGPGNGTGTGTTVSDRSSGLGALAFTGSDPAPAIVGAGLLIAIGVVFLVSRAIRSRRHRDHLED